MEAEFLNKFKEAIREVVEEVVRKYMSTQDLWVTNNLVKAAAKEAVKEYALAQNPSKDEITQRQAFEEFGEGWVLNQVSNGLIKPFRKGVYKNSPKMYSRSSLLELKYGANPLLRAVTN